jgi:hypothetical protein
MRRLDGVKENTAHGLSFLESAQVMKKPAQLVSASLAINIGGNGRISRKNCEKYISSSFCLECVVWDGMLEL